jgi:alpha-tubulin suppressor-like RCC1 family protein
VTDAGHVYTWGYGETGALGHIAFDNQWLPKRVEMLYDSGVVAVSVSAGVKHTLVAAADGAVWAFGSLNAIGAWSNSTVKTMHGAWADTVDGQDDTVDGGLFGWPIYLDPDAPLDPDCFNFLYPRGRARISMPVRVPVDYS